MGFDDFIQSLKISMDCRKLLSSVFGQTTCRSVLLICTLKRYLGDLPILIHLKNYFYWGETELAWRTHPCFSSSLLEVIFSFHPNFCKERHFPGEITKAFSAPSWTNSYWAAFIHKVQYRAGNGPNISIFLQAAPWFLPCWPCGSRAEPHDKSFNYCNSLEAELSAVFPLPTIYVQCRNLITLWYNNEYPGSTLLCRNLPHLLEKFWQLLHGQHRAQSNPLHFWPLLSKGFYTPACSSLFYS